MCTLASILVNFTFLSTCQPSTASIFCYPISAGSQRQLHQQLLRPSRHPRRRRRHFIYFHFLDQLKRDTKHAVN